MGERVGLDCGVGESVGSTGVADRGTAVDVAGGSGVGVVDGATVESTIGRLSSVVGDTVKGRRG
jgi:hypothetical protein